MRLALATSVWSGLLMVAITQSVVASENVRSPPTPVFPNNYHVEGMMSLPYAELDEPFEAWYDYNATRSRTDYFGDLYKIYQFGPKSAPETGDREFGALYKLVYVPRSFRPEHERRLKEGSSNDGLLSRLHDAYKNIRERVASAEGHNSATKRACFSVKGSVGNTIAAQSVLPDMSGFKYDSTGNCPHVNEEHRHSRCELWKTVTVVGDKKNTYKMWVVRDQENDIVIPVHYYMLGYDTLLSSHYDRYDVTYRNFKAGEASDEDFLFDAADQVCGPMPGPGDDPTSGQIRSHMIAQNPIHELVVEPHRYDHIDHEFHNFKRDHNKSYADPESHRKGWFNFLHNSRFIKGKNRELKQFKLGVNRYADNDLKELSYLRGRLSSNVYNGGLDYAAHHDLRKSAGRKSDDIPESWNWDILGAVTPVKDQATCGSCWSFGTSGTIEGAYFVKYGKLPNLSQQQMVDCSWKYGNNGCDGGEDFRAYKYIMDAGGLALQEDYGHYMGVDGKCHDDDVAKFVQIKGFYNVTSNDVEALKHAVRTYGPVTVGIDASRPTFTFYSHGAFYDEKCGNKPQDLDHQVLVVGYATVDGKFVWIVKNSWSTYWGDNGYVMMSAENNNCGVMTAPTVPIIA